MVMIIITTAWNPLHSQVWVKRPSSEVSLTGFKSWLSFIHVEPQTKYLLFYASLYSSIKWG